MPVSSGQWAACADPDGQIVSSPRLCLDVSPNRGSAAIGLAGRREDGMVQLEVVRHAVGDGWVLAEMGLARAAGHTDVALDGRSQAAAFRADLQDAGWTVHELGPADQVDACIGLQRDVLAGDRLRHLGDPVLGQALEVATSRLVGEGGGGAWARRKSDGDITAIVAVTGARWLLAQVQEVVPLVAFR